MNYKLIISPWRNEFIEVIQNVKEELIISSPFIDKIGIEILFNMIKTKDNISFFLLTNLTKSNIINDLIQPDALLKLYDLPFDINISSIGKLHAKIYLVDKKNVVITSANLTKGGLLENFEYGIEIDDIEIASSIREDMLKYFSLGNIVDKEIILKISHLHKNINELKSKIIEKGRESKIEERLRKIEYELETEIFKNRIKENKTINSIFADTIIFLLKRKGPLKTKELHPLIQKIHPDICDDTIDRVINGQSFGKNGNI